MSARIRAAKSRSPKPRRREKLTDILSRVTPPKEAGVPFRRAFTKVQKLTRKADEDSEAAIRELFATFERAVPAANRCGVRASLRRLSRDLRDLVNRRESGAYLIGRALGGMEAVAHVVRLEGR